MIYNLELNDNEMYLLYQIMRKSINYGGTPESMRDKLEIYDKIEKLIRKE